jgi:hypothetical protein
MFARLSILLRASHSLVVGLVTSAAACGVRAFQRDGVRRLRTFLLLLWFGGYWFRRFAGVAGVSATDWIDHKDEIG